MERHDLHDGETIRTLSGIHFNIARPTATMMDINDIAHSLSFQMRFGGHLPVFYSVAQHCYHTSFKVPDEHKLAALMHDASEFIMLDMPRPIKRQLTNYKEFEDRITAVMAAKYSFQFPFDPCIKKADIIMLETEYTNLVEGPMNKLFIPMSQPVAKQYFLNRFHELTNNQYI